MLVSERGAGGLLAGSALLAICFVAFIELDRRTGTLRAGSINQTIVWFSLAFVVFAAMMWMAERQPPGDRIWLLLVVVGLGLRLLMLFTEPTLSDDVYRYLWEGHLVTEGVSPYRFIIADPAAVAYDIPARSLANNTDLASPYLPVAHAIFGGAAAVAPSSPWTMQLIMIGFDVVAMSMISLLLGLAGLPRRRALLYWLNPLVILEVAHAAHLDAIIVALALAGVYLTLDERRWRDAPIAVMINLAAPMLIAAATLTRPIAVLLVPVLWWFWTWGQRAVWAVALGLPILVSGLAVGFGFGDGGTGVFGAARAYTRTFRFNGGIYHWLETWIGGRGLDDKGWNEPVMLTQLIVAGVVITLMGWVVAVARREHTVRSVLRLLGVPLALYVLLTPVLHPWYVLPLLAIVPFMAPASDENVQRWLVPLPWLLLSGLLILSYLTYENPAAYAEREWVRRLEWWPVLAAVFVAGLWSAQRGWLARR